MERGVLQGSALRPIVFSLYIADLSNLLESACLLLTEETKLYAAASNSAQLHGDLNGVARWCQDWILLPNVERCRILHFGKRTPGQGIYIEASRWHQDFGVTVIEDLFWTEHIQSVARKASSIVAARKCAKLGTKLTLDLSWSSLGPYGVRFSNKIETNWRWSKDEWHDRHMIVYAHYTRNVWRLWY